LIHMCFMCIEYHERKLQHWSYGLPIFSTSHVRLTATFVMKVELLQIRH